MWHSVSSRIALIDIQGKVADVERSISSNIWFKFYVERRQDGFGRIFQLEIERKGTVVRCFLPLWPFGGTRYRAVGQREYKIIVVAVTKNPFSGFVQIKMDIVRFSKILKSSIKTSI